MAGAAPVPLAGEPEVRFVNLTPHEIVVRREDGSALMVASSGLAARCTASSEVVGEIDGVKVVRSTFGPVEGLPEPQDGTIYIVSSMVAQQVPGRDDVVAPDTGPTAIREAGQVVAVKRFQRF